jgi:NAD+ synthase
LKLIHDVLKVDMASIETRIERFIKDYISKCKAKGVVLGVSGGVDSCTNAAIASLSLGGDKVLGLALPEEETYSALDVQHAKLVAKKFDFNLKIVDISPILRAFQNALPDYDPKDKLSKGNLKARIRMLCLYYYANSLGRIVMGSSDKSETMMGYFTKWGDVAADISPFMDLYKTQVRQLAQHVGIPQEIAQKPSTPALWPGHLAEEELGIKYEVLDLILYGFEHFMTTEEISKQLNLPIKLVNGIKKRWVSMEHKRRAPLTVKLEYRTVGTDFRLPYTAY